jgi:hypothetical protein
MYYSIMSNNSVTKIAGDSFHISVPLEKVDKENRRVSGWASLDNLDIHGDVILAEANRNAFANFRGNIREQHTTLAVGKMVDFKEDTFYDTKTESFYNGIFVTVYISKGAQDTWEKILDGTLTGFSIGGNVTDAESTFVKEANATVRIIKAYELFELSLVDNPANQLANIFAITKDADGNSTMKGMVTEIKAETIFFCEEDSLTKTSADEAYECPNCGKPMSNIGWFEYNDSDDKLNKVRNIVKKHIAKPVGEGGVENMPNEEENNETVVEQVADDSVETAVDAGDNAGGEQTEAKADEVEGTEETAEVVAEADTDEEPTAQTIEQMIADLQAMIENTVVKNGEIVTKQITEVSEKVASIETSLTKSYAELEAKHLELSANFATFEDRLTAISKNVDGLNNNSAIKKSGDLGGSAEEVAPKKKESLWGGTFLGVDDL